MLALLVKYQCYDMKTSCDELKPYDLNTNISELKACTRIVGCHQQVQTLRMANLVDAGPLENALDWAEDLIPGNGHVIGHIAEDSRLHKVALLTCATELPSPLLTDASHLPACPLSELIAGMDSHNACHECRQPLIIRKVGVTGTARSAAP